MVDAVLQSIERVAGSELPPGLGVEGEYVLATLHRRENVDGEERLRKIVRGLELVAEGLGVPVIFPAHPRTRRRMARFGIRTAGGVKLTRPLGYFAFLRLLGGAKLVLTDSGGVQEEACVMRVPCVTLRRSTERPETLEVGSNVLASAESESIVEKARLMAGRSRDWENPFGGGRAAERIVEILMEGLGG